MLILLNKYESNAKTDELLSATLRREERFGRFDIIGRQPGFARHKKGFKNFEACHPRGGYYGGWKVFVKIRGSFAGIGPVSDPGLARFQRKLPKVNDVGTDYKKVPARIQ
ncbi:MAG: hypothetical protein ACRESZ_00950 [Methylococcales bacterium]